MSRKTKINVLLPIKMVGELERLSRLGKRSEFIQKAIRTRLDSKDGFDPGDIPTRRLMALLHTRLADRNDASSHMVREFLRMELES